MKWGKNEWIKIYTEICCDRISYDENITRRRRHTTLTHTHTHSFNHTNLFACVRFRLCSRLWACSIQYWNEISEKGCLRPPEHSESAHTHAHSDRMPKLTHTHTRMFINFWIVFYMCISSLSLIDDTRFPSIRFMFGKREHNRTPCAIVPRPNWWRHKPPLLLTKSLPVGVMHKFIFEQFSFMDIVQLVAEYGFASIGYAIESTCPFGSFVRHQLTIRWQRKLFCVLSLCAEIVWDCWFQLCQHDLSNILFDSST